MRLITDRAEARACYEKLNLALASLATETASHKVIFRPGGLTAPTYFFREQGFGVMLTDGSGLTKSINRYWNCFGIGGSPKIASERISVEINHPHEGRSSVSGRFLYDDNGYWIGHTGKIGGGIPGSDAGALERLTGHRGVAKTIDGHEEKLALFEKIEPSVDFLARIAEFVRLMDGAKTRLQDMKPRV